MAEKGRKVQIVNVLLRIMRSPAEYGQGDKEIGKREREKFDY